MKNILIVCADKDLRKDLSKLLAGKLKCLYLDIDELMDYEILNRQDVSLGQAEEFMREMERNSIERTVGFKNCLMTISHTMYVANDNFKLFNEIHTIFVKLSKGYFVAKANQMDKYKLEQELCLHDKISALIEDKCKNTIEKNTKTIEEICKEIINILK